MTATTDTAAFTTKRGFVSRKQGGFLFAAWKTEWWEVDANTCKGYTSPDNAFGKPQMEIKPKRAWKVTKQGKHEFLVHWKEGGTLHFKSTEGEDDRDVWVQCFTSFLYAAQEDINHDGDDADNNDNALLRNSQVTPEQLFKSSEKHSASANQKKKDDFDLTALNPEDVQPQQIISKTGSFGSLIGLLRPARLDVSESTLDTSNAGASNKSSPGNLSPHGGRISSSINNGSPPTSMRMGSSSVSLASPIARAAAAMDRTASFRGLNNNLPRMGSSRDMLDNNQVFMGKASSFAQKIAQDVDRSNARKKEGAPTSPHGSNTSNVLIDLNDDDDNAVLSTKDKHHHQGVAVHLISQEGENVHAQQYAKSPEQNALLVSTVSSEFWPMLSHSVTKIASPQSLVDLMYSVTIPANTTVVTQGKQVDKLYVIETGRVGVYSVDFVDKPRGELEYLKKRGDCFFVHSLMYHQPGPFTITTHVECRMWALSLKQFNDFMTLQTKKLVVRKLKLLESVTLIATSLSFETIVQLADCLEFQEFSAREQIVQEGDLLRKLYIVDEGKVELGGSGGAAAAVLEKNDVFGEWALLAEIRSKMSLRASASQGVTLLVLDIEEMEELIGPFRKFVVETHNNNKTLRSVAEDDGAELSQLVPVQEDDSMFKFSFGASAGDNRIVQMATLNSMNRFAKRLGGKREVTAAAPAAGAKIFGRKSLHPEASFSRLAAQIEDNNDMEEEEDIGELNMDIPFERKPTSKPEITLEQGTKLVRQLGQGQFGSVHLAQTSNNEDRVAIKVMFATKMTDNGWEKMIECERDAMLELAGHPFLVSLLNYSSMQQKLVYLVMELCDCGNLGDLLNTQPDSRLWDETQARFYLANIVLGLEYMHSKDIIYRDLKTENIMVTSQGYCKLADFGLAKKTKQTYTFCGTPDFMAPEILLRKGHGAAVDWWACGVLLFEMLAGVTPFAAYENSDIYERILAHTDPKQLDYPKQCSSMTGECKNLIQNFLHPKKTKRLGVKFPGIVGIKRHPFFKDFDWESVAMQKLEAPLRPSKSSSSSDAAAVVEYDATTRKLWEKERVDTSGWAAKFAKQ